jgi:hypothetical protein
MGCPGFHNPEVAYHELRAIRQDGRYSIAFLDTEISQCRR